MSQGKANVQEAASRQQLEELSQARVPRVYDQGTNLVDYNFCPFVLVLVAHYNEQPKQGSSSSYVYFSTLGNSVKIPLALRHRRQALNSKAEADEVATPQQVLAIYDALQNKASCLRWFMLVSGTRIGSRNMQS